MLLLLPDNLDGGLDPLELGDLPRWTDTLRCLLLISCGLGVRELILEY